MKLNRILVSLDGSEHAEKVLASAAGLALKLNAEVVLLSVSGLEPSADDAEGDHAQAASEYLDRHVKALADLGVTAKAVVDSGLPAETIMAVAEREEVAFIAMATHRESVIERGILGSVTDRVVRSSSIPVLAVNPEQSGIPTGRDTWTPNAIIVPLDGSALAAQCVPPAIEIAKSCGAELIFIRAVHLPSFAVSGPGAEFYGNDYGVAKQRESARQYLEQFVDMAKEAGVSAHGHAALGNAAARIIEESRNEPDSIIVISSHGRGGIRRMMLGSVADKIVRSSHHPVLVIKHAD